MLVKPKAQTRWQWIIAAYLFLGGLGGGAYLIGVVADLASVGKGWAGISKIGVGLGFPCVAIGCAFLFFDLGTPKNFWRACMRPQTSWMARGVFIISIFMILGIAHSVLWSFSDVLAKADGARQVISILGAIFALATVIYTGILLGASRPLAFWCTAVLPELFLVSALSTGVMAIIFFGTIGVADRGAIAVLQKLYIALAVLELLALGLFFHATHRVSESRASAQLVLRGEVAPFFWLGVVLLGLLIPLVLTILALSNPERAMPLLGGILAPLCALAGGLFLRQVVLAGGIHAPLKAGRFEYVLTNV